MFEENENLVEESTENVDQLTTEENVEDVAEETGTEVTDSVEEVDEQPKGRFYTDEEIKLMKTRAKKRGRDIAAKEYKNKYSRLETVVNTGLGTSDVEESTKKLEEFYKKRGITIPEEPTYSERETELLANNEAQEIIEAGFDEVVEEVDRLASIGVENMSPRDKAIFTKLASYRQSEEQERDLRSIGVSKDEINSEEFKEFTNKLNPNLSLKEKYEMYSAMKPKKQVKQIGSVKSGMTSQVKDYYSPDEIARMTDEELDDPKVWEAVRKSMTGRA